MAPIARDAACALLCALLAVPNVHCRSRSAGSPLSGATPIHPATLAAAAVASNRFGFDVYAKARKDDENLVLSPISASLALAIAAAGAKSETLAQMSRVLHVDTLADAHAAFADLIASFPDSPDIEIKAEDPSLDNVVPSVARGPRGAVLHVADRVWAQAHWTYREDFLSILRDRYHAPLGQVDFQRASEAARAEINAWIGQQTRGRIRDLLPEGSVDDSTRLVLTNAVYFKGSWMLPFSSSSTREEDFATPNDRVQAHMMRQLNHFRYARMDGLALVELPYVDSPISMVVVLPDDEHALTDVENRVGREYDRWVAALADKRVELWLPRWTRTQRVVLDAILASLGMPLPFTRGADFSGMTDMPTPDPGKFHVGTIIQEAFVEVNEFGTEATAANAITMSIPLSAVIDRAPEPEPVIFHADHPFLYVIREERTGAVLFVGRVMDPR